MLCCVQGLVTRLEKRKKKKKKKAKRPTASKDQINRVQFSSAAPDWSLDPGPWTQDQVGLYWSQTTRGPQTLSLLTLGSLTLRYSNCCNTIALLHTYTHKYIYVYICQKTKIKMFTYLMQFIVAQQNCSF